MRCGSARKSKFILCPFKYKNQRRQAYALSRCAVSGQGAGQRPFHYKNHTDPEKSVGSGGYRRDPVRLHLFLDHQAYRVGGQYAGTAGSRHRGRRGLLAGLPCERSAQQGQNLNMYRSFSGKRPLL